MNRESERKRLVEILKQNCHCINEDCEKCSSNGICFTHREADHLLDNGIFVPPVKVGDMVYFVIEDDAIDEKHITSQRINDVSTRGLFVSSSTIEENCGSFEPYSELGKTVFTSREDAVKALKGGENK
jgi:hypothetical protein